MTKAQWNSTSMLRTELAAILAGNPTPQENPMPILATAIQLLREEAEPTTTQTSTINPVEAAALYNQKVGYYKAFRDLEALAVEAKVPFKPTVPRLSKDEED